jgi:integrase
MRGSIVKRGKTYSLVYRAPDPKTGVSRQVWKGGYPTHRSAEKALKDIVSHLDAGTYTAPTKSTIGQFLTGQWLPAIAATVRPNTASLYKTNIDAYIIPNLGGTQLRALVPSQLNVLYAELLDHGRRDGRGLSTRSVRIVHTTVHRALRDAVRWGLVSRNVADLADPPRDGSPEKTAWTPEQVTAFLALTEKDRLSGLWRLAAATGMRRGELLGLRWSDVNLDASSITVRQNLVLVDHKRVYSEPKSAAGRRTISIDVETVAVLRAHRARQAAERLAWGAAWTDTGLLFGLEDGNPLHPETVTKCFDRLRRAGGLPATSFHGLRHSHATALLRAGVPIRVVSQRLGHASVAVTLGIYAHVLPGDDEAAASAWGRISSVSK